MLYAIARLFAIDVSSLRMRYLSHSNSTPRTLMAMSEKKADDADVMCLVS